MRDFSVEAGFQKILEKMCKKDKQTYEILMRKIEEILNTNHVNHYKNLRKPLQHLKRVHVRGPFVLTFKYMESEDQVIFYDFDHHDNIYKT